MAIRFTDHFDQVFKLLSMLKADNMVRIDYSSPDGRDSDIDHWIQIRDVMSIARLEISVESLTVLEWTLDMAEIYAACGDSSPTEIEDDQVYEEMVNLLDTNIETCTSLDDFVGPIEPLEQNLKRLDLPF